METLERTPAETEEVEALEAATPDKVVGAQKRAEEEFLKATHIAGTTTELRFELAERLAALEATEEPTTETEEGGEQPTHVERIVEVAFLKKKIGGLETLEESPEISARKIIEKIREGATETLAA